MKDLAGHVAAHAPLIWVISDEPRRVFEHLKVASGPRPIMRMDLFAGLERWDSSTGRWVLVLSEQPEEDGPPLVIKDLLEALNYADQHQGVFIQENAHLVAPTMISLLSYLSRKWVDAFYSDDVDHMGPTIVLISCKDEVPPEIIRNTIRIASELPNPEAVDALLDFIAVGAKVSLGDDNARTQLVRAGSGLTEYEIINAAVTSISDTGAIDAARINSTKLAILAKDGLLEVRPPKLTMAGVGGLDQAKEILAIAAWLWTHPNEAAELDLEPLRRIVLVGLQGAGKSLICEAAAHALGHDLVKFSVSNMMNKYIGESEANIRRAFAQVRAMAPLTLWMDEAGRDLSGSQSSASVDGGTTDRIHSTFLQNLQELPDGVFLVAAANRIDGLPPEMLRADRMDKILFVGFPTAEERKEIWTIHLAAQADNYDLETLAEASDKYTGAEIKAAIKEVKFLIGGRHQRRPSTEDLLEFLPTMRNRVWITHRDDIRTMYRRAKTDWAWASSGQEAEADRILQGRVTEGGGAVRPLSASGGGGSLFEQAAKGAL